MTEKNKKKDNGKWYFLIIVVIIYIIIFLFFRSQSILILNKFLKLIIEIAPVFLLVYVLMVLINYFVNTKVLKKYMGEEAGVKGWLISIGTGIISIGPIYMWYPLMKDLQTKGIRTRFLATFLYNRGIKIQWTPLLIAYFGWSYSIILLLVMAFLSIPQGIITEKLIEKTNKLESKI